MNTSTISPDIAWKAALGELEMQMTKATFTTWLQGTRALSCVDDEFVIGVRNDFAKDWLENRLRDLIVRTLSSVINRHVCVVWPFRQAADRRQAGRLCRAAAGRHLGPALARRGA